MGVKILVTVNQKSATFDSRPIPSKNRSPATKIMPTELTSQPQDMHIVDQDHRDEHADDTSKMQSRKRLAPTFSNDLES